MYLDALGISIQECPSLPNIHQLQSPTQIHVELSLTYLDGSFAPCTHIYLSRDIQLRVQGKHSNTPYVQHHFHRDRLLSANTIHLCEVDLNRQVQLLVVIL
uniref:CSON010054 protein n=1 Tax=Culicoides sonorensis TaxID=179676 RepID=A0A336N1N2_CULSO